MPYAVAPLPYDYKPVEATIDETTMKLHDDKHHQAYVDKANDAIAGTECEGEPAKEVLQNLSSPPADKQDPFRNNSGGLANHTPSWESMSPDSVAEPSGALGDAIYKAFGSLEAFEQQFEASSVSQFDAGWTWLVIDGGQLKLTRTPSQDSLVLEGHMPLLGNDVWEHAYYLTYNNRRPDYLKAWWDVVNWNRLAERYSAASNFAPARGSRGSTNRGLATGIASDGSWCALAERPARPRLTAVPWSKSMEGNENDHTR